jgi:mono/diheme cytochrome c family protein
MWRCKAWLLRSQAQRKRRAHHVRLSGGNVHVAVGCVAAALALAGCTQYPTGGNVRLHNDMGTQPLYRPHRDPRPLPEHAVPRPAPAAPVSLDRGSKLFAIYCTPCHGARGKGDGPVAPKLTSVANLTAEKYLTRDDAFFLDAIRAGSGLMPPQAESISADERRDVVHHLRKLQRP